MEQAENTRDKIVDTQRTIERGQASIDSLRHTLQEYLGILEWQRGQLANLKGERDMRRFGGEALHRRMGLERDILNLEDSILENEQHVAQHRQQISNFEQRLEEYKKLLQELQVLEQSLDEKKKRLRGEGKPDGDPRIFSEREALAALMRTRKIYGKYFGPGGTVRKSDDNPLLNGPRGPLSDASVKRIKYILQQAIARRYRTYKAIKADHHIEIKPPNPDQKNRPRAELEARKELAKARMEAPPVSHHKMEGGRRAFSQKSSYVRKLIAAGEARGPTNYRKYMARGGSSDTESDESDEGSQFRRSMRAFKRARVQR
jgi:hypothetical protein